MIDQVNGFREFAGAVLSILPIFIAFLCAQKTFIQGIALSGIKG